MAEKPVKELRSVTIRFAGDSGDGMQLTGNRFTDTAAIIGNDVATFPDFPAEIRAPAGSLPGVSGFQVQISSTDIHTPGDCPDVLVAMNPAALRTNLGDLPVGGTLFANSDAFNKANLKLAGYASNPLEDDSLSNYKLYSIPMSTLTVRAVEELDLGRKIAERCKNFFALGVMFWLYERPLDPTLKWIQDKFGKNPNVAKANTLSLKAGYNFANTLELLPVAYKVARAELAPGTYRSISGNAATALGLVAAAQRAGQGLFYGSYPITPASDILHELARHKAFGVKTFQAEDEIAAIGAVIGAAFSGAIAVTGTSGPGVALKGEALGLAVMTELPLVVINVQRGGPSTGLPTKTEQADLFQALYGRNGECPLPVLAAATPGDCFNMAFEAVRIALKYMTPVILLTDGYLANGAEPWRIPQVADLPEIAIEYASPDRSNGHGFLPYLRDETTLSRPWAIPGTPGLEHRIGGLEKQDVTGNVNYEPANHEKMIHLRAAKVERVTAEIPPTKCFGAEDAEIALVGWGSTYGAIRTAVERLAAEGIPTAHIHLRHLNPLPSDLGDVLARFDKIVVPEMNLGQLNSLLRARYLLKTVPLNKVTGQPFKVSEITAKVKQVLNTERAV
jgi:2-oxoglutarate ferredoxin oxidoreductase subunit alpha